MVKIGREELIDLLSEYELTDNNNLSIQFIGRKLQLEDSDPIDDLIQEAFSKYDKTIKGLVNR